ncbi:MAG TPA: hypothetical protein VLL96_06015 [Candidatus Deferrimicrobiaceae bacterium]|nr:hypothetical protein [Candidatus Deferrimicrobiaceae bacterium]
MFKKKALVLSLIGVIIALSMISTVSAQTTNGNRPASAVGAGTFVHDHEGVPHNHYFAFGVSDASSNSDGRFYMAVTHEKETHMIVKSDQIQSFEVNTINGGLSATFEGVATVKHMDADWEKGWKFTVEAFDIGSKGADSIHITFTAPDGTQHHMEGTLTSGNIVIKK